jgi:two-component system OmpR family response regulator
VVDDHPDSAHFLAMLISALGHEARHLTDPNQVEAEIVRFNPHVLLLDIAMPDIDGWSLARKIRQQAIGQGLKIVAVTAYAAASDHVKSRQAGFDAHVAKPLEPAEIGVMLDQCFAETIRLPPKRN